MKKLDRCTSFTVAVQVMLYENRWASMACEMGIERPPKKKKLRRKKFNVYFIKGQNTEAGRQQTHKNGIQIKFSTSALINFL